MLFYPFNYLSQRNTQAVALAAEKLKNRNLAIEQILDEDELMNDLKYSNVSQLVNHITKEDMINILKYVVKEPEVDDHKLGHKFPFNASELLSGENGSLVDKFFEDSNGDDEDEKYEELDELGGDKSNKKEEKVEKTEDKIEKENKAEKENIQKVQGENDDKKTKEDLDGEVNAIVQKLQAINIQIDESLKDPKSEIKDSGPEENIIHEENKEVSPEPSEEKKTEKEENTENKSEENKVPTVPEETKKEEKIIAPRYEVLDYFLSFLDNQNELNYVLAGYFSKIFGSLRYNRPAALTRYLFLHKREYMFKMIRHLNRKAIADTMIKILTIDASDIASDLQIEFEYKIKYEIIDKILDSFNPSDEERCQNICDLFTEAINNKKFSMLLLKNPRIFKKLFLLIVTNIKTEYVKELLRVSNKLSEIILTDIKTKINKDQENANNLDNFDKGFADFEEMTPNKPPVLFEVKEFPHIVEVLGENEDVIVREYVNEEVKEGSTIHMTFDKTVRVLGIKRLLIFDFIKNMIEIITLSINQREVPDSGDSVIIEVQAELKRKLQDFINILIQNDFFKKSIENFFNYEWNNSYQKSFEKLMEIIINSPPSDNLLRHIFGDLKFIDRMVESFRNKFSFNSGRQANPGYLSFVLEISNLVGNNSNSVLKSLTENNERWKSYYSEFVDPIRKRFATNLLYESKDDNNLFKDDFGRDSPQICKIDLNDTITSEKNFIETIRKQASVSFEKFPIDLEAEKPITSNPEESKLNEDFYDNNYWKSPIVSYNKLEEEILSELNL